MTPELFYFDELADPRQTAEMADFSTCAGGDVRWQPQEVAHLRGQTTGVHEEKMPHEKTKS